jgi:splicing factor U2AF subunit
MQGIVVMSDEEAQEHFDNFFEDVFIELEDKYGEIEEMNVCDNLGDHLVGNVYVKVGLNSSVLMITIFIITKICS